MATSTTYTFALRDVPLDIALEVLSSAEFDIAQQIAQEGTKSAEVTTISRDDDTFVYEMHAVEYVKGLRGLDRSKTERTVTRVTWDLKARKSDWTYRGPHGDRVKVWGATHIKPLGDGSEVTSEFHIDVKIPLVGGQLEKLVVNASKTHMKDHFERLAGQMCRARLAERG